MRSASVIVLARLVHEFRESDMVVEMVPRLLDTVLLLLRERNHAVIKSVIAFCNSSIACMPRDKFEVKITPMIQALLSLPKDMKHHFKGKTRTVLEKIVRKYGCVCTAPCAVLQCRLAWLCVLMCAWFATDRLDLVASALPAADAKLLTHIRKQNARRERKRAARKTAGADADADVGMAMAGGSDDESESEFESDYEEDIEDPEGADLTTRRQLGKVKGNSRNAWIIDGVAGQDPVDFLNPGTSAVVGTNPAALTAAVKRINKHRHADAKLSTGKDGRLLVAELEEEARRKPRRHRRGDDSDEEDGARGRRSKRKDNRKRRRHEDTDNRSAAQRAGGVKNALAQQGWGAGRKSVLRPRQDPYSGASYGSKKAGGDVMRKGTKFEPFTYDPLLCCHCVCVKSACYDFARRVVTCALPCSYIPMDPKAMSGAGRERAVSRFASVVGSASNKGKQDASHGRGKKRRRR